MFFGVADSRGRTAEEQVRDALLAVECPAASKIVEAVRLGVARDGPTDATARPRPVRVPFVTAKAVYEVFKASKALRERRKIGVDKDLTRQQQEMRTALLGDYKKLKENGYRAFWRGERLFYSEGQGSRPTHFSQGDNMPPCPGRGGRTSPGRSA